MAGFGYQAVQPANFDISQMAAQAAAIDAKDRLFQRAENERQNKSIKIDKMPNMVMPEHQKAYLQASRELVELRRKIWKTQDPAEKEELMLLFEQNHEGLRKFGAFSNNAALERKNRKRMVDGEIEKYRKEDLDALNAFGEQYNSQYKIETDGYGGILANGEGWENDANVFVTPPMPLKAQESFQVAWAKHFNDFKREMVTGTDGKVDPEIVKKRYLDFAQNYGLTEDELLGLMNSGHLESYQNLYGMNPNRPQQGSVSQTKYNEEKKDLTINIGGQDYVTDGYKTTMNGKNVGFTPIGGGKKITMSYRLNKKREPLTDNVTVSGIDILGGGKYNVEFIGKGEELDTKTGTYKETAQKTQKVVFDTNDPKEKTEFEKIQAATNFPVYEYEKSLKKSATTDQPKKEETKMSWPEWKAKNPSGTPQQYKTYKNS